MVIIAAAITLSLTVLFKISTIEVTGIQIQCRGCYKESGISTENNLFLINKDYAVQNIKEKLPYIGEVTVSRKFPGTVSISVSDAIIAGAVSYNGGYLVIDSNGKAVEQLTEYPTDYPEIID